jgi:hypothetical protein
MWWYDHAWAPCFAAIVGHARDVAGLPITPDVADAVLGNAKRTVEDGTLVVDVAGVYVVRRLPDLLLFQCE